MFFACASHKVNSQAGTPKVLHALRSSAVPAFVFPTQAMHVQADALVLAQGCPAPAGSANRRR